MQNKTINHYEKPQDFPNFVPFNLKNEKNLHP